MDLLGRQARSHQRQMPLLATAGAFVLAHEIESLARQLMLRFAQPVDPDANALSDRQPGDRRIFRYLRIVLVLAVLLYPPPGCLNVDRSFYPVSIKLSPGAIAGGRRQTSQ